MNKQIKGRSRPTKTNKGWIEFRNGLSEFTTQEEITEHPVSKAMPYSRHAKWLSSGVPLELISLGSMEKTAMISWWWEQRPGKEPCVPHACLTCSHLSGTCFSTSQWEHFVPIQILCIFTWKNLLLKLCQCWGVLVPRQEKKLRMGVCFQERVFSLSPQILLPFTCSASWTGGCV